MLRRRSSPEHKNCSQSDGRQYFNKLLVIWSAAGSEAPRRFAPQLGNAPSAMLSESGGVAGLCHALQNRKKIKRKWSERQDSNLRRLAPKASALARLSYA